MLIIISFGRGGRPRGHFIMKKKLLSAIIAVTIAFEVMTPTMMVSAEPTNNSQVNETRSKYEELQGKINALNEKIQQFDAQISPLVINMDENNSKIGDIEKEVENKNKEIEQLKKDIEEKEEILGKRLREVYKSGGQTNYISLIFSANSLSDLIMKIDSANKLVKIDKKIVNELSESKSDLDEKVSTLGTKAKELEVLNDDIKEQVQEINSKKEEQNVIIEQVKSEKEAFDKEFLTPAEMELIKSDIDVISNPNSTIEEIRRKVELLKAELGELKSEEAKNAAKAAIDKGNSRITELQEAAKNNEQKQPQTNRGQGTPLATGSIDALLQWAYSLQGLPYVYGAEGPNTFDCSGFTSYVYRHALGIEITRTTRTQINQGIEVSQSELKPGDLIFPHEDHVAIYVGDGKMIHAPHTGDVIKVAPVYKFWRARRIVK